jgi:hypothetical protein
MCDIAFTPGKEVIKTDDFIACIEKTFRKMGAEEAGSTGN